MQIWFYVLQVNQFIKERERQRKMERMNLQGIEERERKRERDRQRKVERMNLQGIEDRDRQAENVGANDSTRN